MYYFNYDTFFFQSLIYFSHIPVNFALLAEELVQHEPLKEWHHTHLNMMHAAHRQKNFAAREFVRGRDLGVSASDQHDVNFGQSFWKMFNIFLSDCLTNRAWGLRAIVCMCVCVCLLSRQSYCFCRLGVHPPVNVASCFSTDIKSVLRVCDWYVRACACCRRGRGLRSCQDFS